MAGAYVHTLAGAAGVAGAAGAWFIRTREYSSSKPWPVLYQTNFTISNELIWWSLLAVLTTMSRDIVAKSSKTRKIFFLI